MPEQPEFSGLRHNNFDVLRLLFAACVIVSHAYPLLLGRGTPAPFNKLSHGQVDLGGISVDCFFIISGFLVTSSFERSRTALDYLRKRSLRIFPGLAAALVVCVFLVAPLGGASFPGYLLQRKAWNMFSILLMRHVGGTDELPGVFTTTPYHDLDGAMWTLQFEFGCYLIVMALGLLGTFRRPCFAPWIIGGLLVLMAICQHGEVGSHVILPWYGSLAYGPHFAVFFLAGSLAYLLREKTLHSRLLAAACVVVIALCHKAHLAEVLPIAGTYLLLYAAFSRSVRLPHFGGKVDLSYGVYLYGWPVEQLLIYHMGTHLTPLALMGLALPIAAALAWVSWTLVERPCLQLKQKKARSAPATDMQYNNVNGT